jgi:Fe-S-cluster containining protein
MKVNVTDNFAVLYDSRTDEEKKKAIETMQGYSKIFEEFRKANKPRDAVIFYYNEADRLVKEQILDRGLIGDCRAGCTFCCHIRVGASTLEMYEIVTYCTQNGITPDTAQFAMQLDKLNVDGKLVDMDPDKWMSHATFDERRCVFLKDGMCSIYPVRPVSCRTHFISTETTNTCEDGCKNNAMVATVHSIDVEALITAYLNSTGFVEESIPLMLARTCNKVLSTPVEEAPELIVPPTGIIQ